MMNYQELNSFEVSPAPAPQPRYSSSLSFGSDSLPSQKTSKPEEKIGFVLGLLIWIPLSCYCAWKWFLESAWSWTSRNYESIFGVILFLVAVWAGIKIIRWAIRTIVTEIAKGWAKGKAAVELQAKKTAVAA